MSLLGKPIEEVIETLYNSIKNKRQIITNIKREYNIDDDSFNDIKINRFKLIDLLDEFEVTISQSLQAIQTFKVEIFNLKEKQTTEEILNLTNEFQMKYNSNSTNNLNNNNNILDKIENNKTENSIIEPKNEKNNSVQNNILNDDLERDGKNEIIKGKNQKENIEVKYKKEFDALKEAKLNFDYSSLLNNSQTSLKSSISNLDKFRLDNNKSDIIQNQNTEINTHINKNNFNQKNTPNLLKENNDIDMITNNLNKEDIEEEQPSKLNINIIRSNNDIVNKMKLIEKNESNKDISCFSENMEYNTSNNTDNFNINKFYSMRQSEIPGYNINSNQSFNYKFNLLNSDSNPNIIENEKINNNFEESDIISLVSKNDIIKEKFQKLENDEKINKLIEEIFSIKAFKLYILDKFGNGKQDIFFKKVKNGEINKDELESELNILKEINNSNNDNNLYLTETKNRKKNNKGLNKIMSDTDINNINFNTENIETNFAQTDKNNIYKKINKKKNIIKEESKNRNPSNIKNNLRDNYKNNAINISNNTNSYSNKNKNISSHSVSSIRAKIKSKKF
jgi:hypothetical protein